MLIYGMIRKVALPVQVRELQNPWVIDPMIEKAVRTGARPMQILPQKPIELIKWRTGRAGTVQSESITTEMLEKMKKFMRQEYFPATEDPYQSVKARHELELFLEGRGLQLLVFAMGKQVGPDHYHSSLYHSARHILEILPLHHLSQKSFRKLILGGFYGSPSTYSEYYNGTVHMYQCAVMGPRRNFHALLLHEIGHAFEKLLSHEDRNSLFELAQKTESKFATNYLLGKESRILEQEDFAQFVAENYLHYVAHQNALMDFVESQKGRQNDIWHRIVGIYFRNFCNTLYV